MTTKLIRPDNHQPGAYVARLRGHICLRMADTVTPAVRRYPEAQVIARNAELIATARNAKELPDRILYLWQLEADIAAALKEELKLVLYLTESAAEAVNASAHVRIVTFPDVSLFHKSMVEQKAA